MQQIEDYLQTQALKLNKEAIAVSRMATQMVINNGVAHFEDSIFAHLPEKLLTHLPRLKQIFMALDSVYSQQNIQTAVIFAHLPNEQMLVSITAQGLAIEQMLPENDDSAWQYLAVRTAQSGWANVADNVSYWLDLGELQGEHNRRAAFQAALPICGEDGSVYGVLHLEHFAPLNENDIAQWVGLALGILPVLREMLPGNTGCEDNE